MANNGENVAVTRFPRRAVNAHNVTPQAPSLTGATGGGMLDYSVLVST